MSDKKISQNLEENIPNEKKSIKGSMCPWFKIEY